MHVHAVFVVKNREPLLTPAVRQKILPWIFNYAKEKKIFMDCINGDVDHVHCMISLKSTQTIAQTMQFLKGGSAYFINQSDILRRPFEWQHEYYAGAVSRDHVPIVRKYIFSQQQHHQKKTFDEEYRKLISMIQSQ